MLSANYGFPRIGTLPNVTVFNFRACHTCLPGEYVLVHSLGRRLAPALGMTSLREREHIGGAGNRYRP